jgi:hypothetical protein
LKPASAAEALAQEATSTSMAMANLKLGTCLGRRSLSEGGKPQTNLYLTSQDRKIKRDEHILVDRFGFIRLAGLDLGLDSQESRTKRGCFATKKLGR